MPQTATLDLLLSRYSTPAKYLVAPAPQGAHLYLILRAAMSAPDHAALQPWRFLLVRDGALQKLGDLFAESFQRRHPEASSDLIERERSKPTRSPLLILLVARPQEHPKVPEWEQLMSLGAAATQMQLMAQALGYGSIWLSGERCLDRWLLDRLGLSADEKLLGYLAMGTPSENCAGKLRKSPWEVTEEWLG
ncbi:MAG: nitroreductase [Pseudomonadota bacterium]